MLKPSGHLKIRPARRILPSLLAVAADSNHENALTKLGLACVAPLPVDPP